MTVKKVFIGKFNSIRDSKKDEKKLRDYGLTPHLFNIEGKYSLLIFSSISDEAAKKIEKTFLAKGFEVFIA